MKMTRSAGFLSTENAASSLLRVTGITTSLLFCYVDIQMSNVGLSVFTSSPHEDQEQKTVGKKVSRIETGSILVLDDDFDITTESWIQCFRLHGSGVSIGTF